jgi:hypothetical protein
MTRRWNWLTARLPLSMHLDCAVGESSFLGPLWGPRSLFETSLWVQILPLGRESLTPVPHGLPFSDVT